MIMIIMMMLAAAAAAEEETTEPGGGGGAVDVGVKVVDVPLVKDQVVVGAPDDALALLNVSETDFNSRVVGGAVEPNSNSNSNSTTGEGGNGGGAVCDPGFFLISITTTTIIPPHPPQQQKLLCSLCPAGFYCPGNSSSSGGLLLLAVALPCPSGTANPDTGGVSLAAACVPCAPGTYYYNYNNNNGGGGGEECLTCPAGTYCNGSGTRTATACPPHTVSSAGSTSLGECVCLPGYLCTYTRTVRVGLRFINISNSSSAAQQQQLLLAPPPLGPEALAAAQALQTSLLAGLGLLQQAEPAAYGGSAASTDIGVTAVFEGFSEWVVAAL